MKAISIPQAIMIGAVIMAAASFLTPSSIRPASVAFADTSSGTTYWFGCDSSTCGFVGEGWNTCAGGDNTRCIKNTKYTGLYYCIADGPQLVLPADFKQGGDIPQTPLCTLKQ